MTSTVRTYRWIVFALAAGYLVYNVLANSWSGFGGPFRYLTIWALVASVVSGWLMLRRPEAKVWPQVTAVLNVMVVFLYWRLYFTDPSLVNGGNPIIWWQEYYLHALGPALQILDALFIAAAFGRPLRAVPALLGVIVIYCLWSEFVIAPLNDKPAGSVTSGLPYPFLNDMALNARLAFYATNLAFSLVALAVLAALCWLGARLRPSRLPAE